MAPLNCQRSVHSNELVRRQDALPPCARRSYSDVQAFNTLADEMTPYLQEVIERRLRFMCRFFCACSFVLGLWFYLSFIVYQY